LSFDYPKRIRFICDRCAICCGDTKDRTRAILLLKLEAYRISKKTSKSVEGFAEEIRGREPYSYKMKKRGNGKCVFLKEDNLCAVYHIRPLVCSFYPFELKDTRNGKHTFAYTNECPCIGKGSELRRSYFEKLFQETAKLTKLDSYR
jgi:Fe-S-cluster containining protein